MELAVQKLNKAYDAHVIALNEMSRQDFNTCVERGVLIHKTVQYLKNYQQVLSAAFFEEQSKIMALKAIIDDYEAALKGVVQDKEKAKIELEQMAQDNAYANDNWFLLL